MLKPYQEMMLQEARKAENDFWDEFEREEADAYRFAVEKGMTVKDITSDELVDWRVCSSDLIERFVDKLGDTAAGLMSAYGRLRATSCCNQRGGAAIGAQQLTGVGRQ
jgi:TRAP-type C4-dicarboxylate transport system substrate-binding protein